jgi:casein kinase 1/casein kinase 1 epsilon
MESYLFERNEPFTEKTVLQIGIQILDSLRVIHDAGYIYKDLKLDNVMIGDDQSLPNSKESLYKCRLIDFGLAKKYLQEDGTHIPKKKE